MSNRIVFPSDIVHSGSVMTDSTPCRNHVWRQFSIWSIGSLYPYHRRSRQSEARGADSGVYVWQLRGKVRRGRPEQICVKAKGANRRCMTEYIEDSRSSHAKLPAHRDVTFNCSSCCGVRRCPAGSVLFARAVGADGAAGRQGGALAAAHESAAGTLGHGGSGHFPSSPKEGRLHLVHATHHRPPESSGAWDQQPWRLRNRWRRW